MMPQINIPLAKDLVFSNFTDHIADVVCCNNCGKKGVPDASWLMAQFVPFNIHPEHVAGVIMCSAKCADFFQLQPDADEVMRGIVERVRKSIELFTSISDN